MKKRYYKIAYLFIIIAILGSICLYSFSVVGESLYYDFENESFEWNPLYKNADYEILSEDNGNKYLKLSYNGQNNRDRQYYDVEATSNSIDNLTKLQINYDVMYSEFTEARTGEMQVKYRTGPGSAETTMAARVAQINGFLQVQGGNGVGYQRIRGIDGNYFEMEANHWYSIKMIVDLDNHLQATYVFDRDTESLLALHEETSTITDITKVNMVTFSSTLTMCLDNVGIFEPNCEGSYIYGKPYLKKGTKERYYFLGKGIDGFTTAFVEGKTTWSIVNPRKGVSINATSGSLNCSAEAEPGRIIIKAERTAGNNNFESKFAVNITN